MIKPGHIERRGRSISQLITAVELGELALLNLAVMLDPGEWHEVRRQLRARAYSWQHREDLLKERIRLNLLFEQMLAGEISPAKAEELISSMSRTSKRTWGYYMKTKPKKLVVSAVKRIYGRMISGKLSGRESVELVRLLGEEALEEYKRLLGF